MTNRSSQLPADVRRAADQGDLITAIRLLRTTRGLNLKDAKQAVETYRRNGTRAPPVASRSNVPADAVAFLHEGDLIGAIRRTRETTGRGLKESKQAVEEYLAANPLINEQFRLASRRHRGPWRGLFWFVVAVVVALVLVQLVSGR